jgi:archaellum component FlaC
MEAKTEYEDLNLHATLCAERYKGIEREFARVIDRMDKIENDLGEMKKEINEGHKSMKTTLIGSAATLLTGLLSLALVIYLN